jgi:hypothetical protein
MEKMLNAFFDIKRISHLKFIPQGQTVNQAHHVESAEAVTGSCG